MDGFQDKEFMSNNDLELDKQSERVLDDLAANELASDENLQGAPKESDTENAVAEVQYSICQPVVGFFLSDRLTRLWQWT